MSHELQCSGSGTVGIESGRDMIDARQPYSKCVGAGSCNTPSVFRYIVDCRPQL